MSRKIKASLAAVAVALAFVAAVAATPSADNSEAGNEPVAFFLGRMIEST